MGRFYSREGPTLYTSMPPVSGALASVQMSLTNEPYRSLAWSADEASSTTPSPPSRRVDTDETGFVTQAEFLGFIEYLEAHHEAHFRVSGDELFSVLKEDGDLIADFEADDGSLYWLPGRIEELCVDGFRSSVSATSRSFAPGAQYRGARRRRP